ncbi:lysine biosynthesis protein LysX [Candidatus Gottesmanbacteria bacterium]|nr:lysine biosynthesis protein LysX [Candidatus Gottesmanbacteria bacterium]
MGKNKKNICLLHNTIRGDEKLLIEAAKKFAVNLDVVDVTDLILRTKGQFKFDVILDRCLSSTKGIHAGLFFEGIGIPFVNTVKVAQICEDKFATSMKLTEYKVPTVSFAMVFNVDQAKIAIEEMGGYPIVIKPTVGSWGRLVNKINDLDALEAILEHKDTFAGPIHKSFYLQKYIEKPGRDIRVHNINGQVIAAIYRKSDHWITNTARGAQPLPCRIDQDLENIAKLTGKAIGAGILGIDVFETKDGYLVNEVNHKLEFKNVQRVTSIDVASKIIKYCLTCAL